MEKRTAKTKPQTTLLPLLLGLLFACPLYASDLKDYKVSLSVKNEKLEQVFKLIEAQVPFKFVYNASFISNQPPVSVDVVKQPLDKILALLVAPFHGSFELNGSNILISTPRMPNQVGNPLGQPAWLAGKIVTTGNTGIQNATVSLKNSKAAAETDGDGNFRLPLQWNADILMVSHIGFRDTAVAVNKDEGYIEVGLQENVAALQDVVVNTGYQSLPKERATGSFAFVDSTLFNRRVSMDVLGRLEGVVPGLLFNRNTVNSAPGQTDISIRGHSTLFSNDQPLVVVDNFPYDGDIANLNPNDVESITVLKDAAAASIWGVRSGNGVIVVTTKKGKRNGKLAVEVNANVTVGAKPNLNYNPNFLPSGTFIDIEENLFNQGYYDPVLSTPYAPVSPVVQILADQRSGLISAADATAKINALRPLDVRNDLSKYFYQPSINQQYAVNLRGGGQTSDYFFSLGYDADRANQVGNSSGRVTLNSSYHFYPAKNLQFSASINYVASTAKDNSPLGNINTSGTGTIYPYAQLNEPIVKDYAQDFVNTAAATGQYLSWNYNPLDELKYADNTNTGSETRLNFGVQYAFPAHITASLNYQYEKASSAMNNDYSDSTYYARNLINMYSQNNGGSLSYPIPVGGILQQASGALSSNHLRGQLNYSNGWAEKYQLDAIAGAEVNEIINETGYNTVYGYDKSTVVSATNIDFADNFNLNPYGSAQIPNTSGFGKTTQHYISYFTNAAYTYNRLYTISASGRIDKSNLFGVNTNQKSVPLYSAGFSWDLSGEKFYRLAWLPYAKLRATYGYNGNLNTTATAVTTIQESSSSYYYNTPYADVASPGNPELKWEKIRMVNFGFDYGLRGKAVTGSIEFYIKKGIDLFGSSPLPPSTGLTSFFGNTAATTGHGLDIVINTRNITHKYFSWASSFMLSRALDKVSKYDMTVTSDQYIGYANASSILPLTGKPVFALYSYRWAGLDPANGNPRGYQGKSVSEDYSAILGNTPLDSMVYNGSSRPTVFGSFSNTFTYKKFSLSANIIYKFGYWFRRSSYLSSGLPWSGNIDYFRRWQKPGDEKFTNVPSVQEPPYDTNRDQFYQYSFVLVDRGDHIRLEDVRLGYDLGKGWRVYGYVNNVGILWRANHDHLDPDLSANSGLSTYPLPRTYAIGINANF